MKPKEKAEYLVLKYSKINARHKDSIKSALIAVDEIINDNPNIYDSDRLNYKYWKEVKQEIEKL